LCGSVLVYAAQAITPIDAEIAVKGHLWTENRLFGPINGLLPHFSRQSCKGRDRRHAKSAESYVDHTDRCSHALFFDFLDLLQYRLFLYRKSENTSSQSGNCQWVICFEEGKGNSAARSSRGGCQSETLGLR